MTHAISTSVGDLAQNGNCEDVEDGKPVRWASVGPVQEWGVQTQGYKGRSVYFAPGVTPSTAPVPGVDDEQRVCGLVHGSSSADVGTDAMVVVRHPDARYFRRQLRTLYRVTFQYTCTTAEIGVYIQGWRTSEGKPEHRTPRKRIAMLPPAGVWTLCERTILLPRDTRRFALLFLCSSRDAASSRPGHVSVDEVVIESVGLAASPDVFPRIQIPEDPRIYVDDTRLEDVLADYRVGKQAAVTRVTSTLREADRMAAQPDEWYRQFFPGFEPRGIYTLACPIHPFTCRYYNDFEWSLEEPWKVICPHCKAEGRTYYSYPNPDYPDDGNGCEPTDEVWRRDHDEAWSKAHRGIPHDQWDGQTHGDSGGGNSYHFLGKYYVNASRRLVSDHIPELALAYHFARGLFPPGSSQHGKADLYAHIAKVILFCYTRAHLGDRYLAAAEGISPAEFAQRVQRFFRPDGPASWHYRELPGFRPFGHSDATAGDPRWERDGIKRPWTLYLFAGAWDEKAWEARNLLVGFSRLRATFDDQDDDVRRFCQRVLVSFPGDRESVAMGQDPPGFYLKRGAFEMELHPYNLESGADNLVDATLVPRLQAGLFLRDDRIIENVARDVHSFLRNFLSQDGLGREGSPNYSSYALRTLDQLYGIKGDFDRDAPYFDRELGGINLFKTRAYRSVAPKMMYYATEDDYNMTWEDSCYLGRRDTSTLTRLERYGGGIQGEHRKYLDIGVDDDGRPTIDFDRSLPLPPMLLHDRRKAILRGGSLDTPTVVSLDYTPLTGHYHWPVQHLMVHACGQELASDLGYLGSDHYLQRWIPSFPAHNCLTLRTSDGDPNPTRKLRGDLRRHFVITPFCQVVDTAEYDEEDFGALAEAGSGEMSRQVLLMLPSPEHQYVIDIARGRGGDTHELYFHSHGLGFETRGIQPQSIPDQEQSLYDHSGWTFASPDNWGARCVQKLAVATSTGSWQAVWSQIDDYRGRPKSDPIIHDDVFLRLWVLDDPGSDVIVGSGPAQRHFKNEDVGREMRIVCVRRPNTGRIDNFVSVIEPYRGDPFVIGVRRLELGVDNDYSQVLAVDTVHGTDYVITYGGPGSPPEVSVDDGAHTIRTDADLAVVSFPTGGGQNMLMAGGSYLNADGAALQVSGPPRWEGRLLDFDDTDSTLTVESEVPFLSDSEARGQVMVVQHDKDRSTFTIAGIDQLAPNRYLVRLAGEPRLFNNLLEVTGLGEDGIEVEPPPVLDGNVSYKIYLRDGEEEKLLGHLRKINYTVVHNERGSWMYDLHKIATDDYTGVQRGSQIGVTRLEKGRDTVFITNFACVAAERL